MDLGEQIVVSPVTRDGGQHRRTPAQLLSESALVIARASRVCAGVHPALRMKRWEGSSVVDLGYIPDSILKQKGLERQLSG